MKEMFSIFREIRKDRCKPAHHITEDVFDSRYFIEQRDLIKKAYGGIKTLRLIFANHPLAKSTEVPDWLYRGKIWTF
jgi:hypothetical protein